MTTKTEVQRTQLARDLGRLGEKIARLRAEADSIEADKLVPLVKEADRDGLSLRVIASYVGVSHVTIMRMLDR